MVKNNNIEKIKTIVLWILFLSSIALVAVRYNIFNYLDISQANIKLINSDKIFSEIIIPKEFVIKLDKYNITKIEEKKSLYFRQVRQHIKTVLSDSNSVKKTDSDDYDQYLQYPGILLSFDGIPSEYIEYSMDIKKSAISDLGYIEKIYIPLDKNVIVFKSDEDFFVLKSSKKNSFSFIDSMGSGDYTKYYPILENVNDNPDILFPLKSTLKLPYHNTESIFENHKISDIAENIFKEKFDFTASFIQKNGVYFYSHNNGQEILKLDVDGNIEYKNSKSDYAQADFDKATKIMLLFLMDLEVNFEDVMIDSVRKIDTVNGTVYDFDIVSRVGDIPVYMSGKNLGHIQVTGDSVSYCRMYLRENKEPEGRSENILQASKVLNDNIKEIMKKLKQKNVEKTLSLVNDVQLVYAFDRGEILRACWKFDINNNIFIINASTGEIIENGMVES